MTVKFTFMTTGKIFVANIVAFWCKGSADNRRFKKSSSARARLGLTVDDWAFFAESDMARLTTLVFSTIEHFRAVEIARMIFGDGWISMGAANLIAEMISTASLFFANKLAFEGVMLFLIALYFPDYRSALAALIYFYFTIGTWTFVAASRANMSTV